MTANERVQLIQQRITTRDNLILIANKFGLFPGQSKISDRMRESLKFTTVDVDLQARSGASAVALTVGFAYDSPELAMRVASEFVSLVVGEDARSRASRATETVQLLTDETKDIEDKLESMQMQIFDVARRPSEIVPEIPERQRSELAALTALKAELIQKSSVYSDAHPSVTALKKRIAAMERSITTKPPVQAQSTQAEDIEALKRQREALQNRLAEANSKLASARLSEKLEREQQSVRMQVIEAPQLPQTREKSGRLKIVALAFAAATLLGLGSAIGPELLKGTIRGTHQLSGVVPSQLIVTIPYIATRGDLIRTRLRVTFGVLSVLTLLTVWTGLVAVIVLNLPVHFSLLDRFSADQPIAIERRSKRSRGRSIEWKTSGKQ